MILLREAVPVRRAKPSKSETGDNWTSHKPELREDFNHCCGYCDAYDTYRHTYYEVDHFVPKDFCKKDGTISLAQYRNLVYSCKFCNLAKRALWPSGNATVFNDGKKGFVDPCDVTYDDHFYRTDEGMIMWKTELGEWMCTQAFKFDERSSGIKLLYNIRRLEKTIKSLITLLHDCEQDSAEFNEIKAKLGVFTLEYFTVHQELINFYD